MEEWKRLEFQYSKQLRESSTYVRRSLYSEAYTVVSKLAADRFASSAPKERTAGTSMNNIRSLSRFLRKDDVVLEVGCGRGYTCMMLSSHVKSIVGTDVSDTSLAEAQEVLSARNINNVLVKKVSAFELLNSFHNEKFTAAISIDVVEHLHPEDAEDHFLQVFDLLKPGGKYIIIMPNRLNGPHDITKEEFPEAKEALGFHLNESTYSELTRIMKKIGFRRFRSFHPRLRFTYPSTINVINEFCYAFLPAKVRFRLSNALLPVQLIARKPKQTHD